MEESSGRGLPQELTYSTTGHDIGERFGFHVQSETVRVGSPVAWSTRSLSYTAWSGRMNPSNKAVARISHEETTLCVRRVFSGNSFLLVICNIWFQSVMVSSRPMRRRRGICVLYVLGYPCTISNFSLFDCRLGNLQLHLVCVTSGERADGALHCTYGTHHRQPWPDR